MLEIIEEALQHGKATCVAFNRRGTLLAAGTSGGSIAIFDFVTRSVARELVPEAITNEDGTVEQLPAVFSVAWSSDGRKLLSTAADGSVVVWDVAESDMSFRATFDSQLHSAQFCPTNDSLALVCPSDDGPMTLALGRGRKRTPMPQMPGFWSEDRACRIPSGGLDSAASQTPGCAAYSKSGRYAFVANNRGTLTVVELGTMDIVQACRIPGSEEGGTMYVKRLELSRDGARLLAVTTAKEIASYDVRDEVLNVNDNSTRILTPSPSLHNHVSRSQWGAACFSHDGEYVLAASGGAPHELHAWRRETGELVRILQGGAEAKGIAQLLWHPNRALAIAVGANGQLYVWARRYAENWSAFDPTYVELEENIKLADDEFDAIARNTTDVFRRSLEEPEAVALDMAVEAAAAVTAAETRVKNQSDFDDRSHAFEQWAAAREGTTAPERPTWRDPIMMDDFKRRSEGFDAWAREKEGVPLPGLPARNEALTSTLDELLGSGRSDAAEDAAQRAHAASLKRSSAIKAAEEARRARVEAAKLAAEKEAEEIRAEIIDVNAPYKGADIGCGYHTDEGEDCMHYLPLEQLEPQEDAVNVVRVRLERWKRKEMRLTASAEKRPRIEGEPDREEQMGDAVDVKEDVDEDENEENDDDEGDGDDDEMDDDDEEEEEEEEEDDDNDDDDAEEEEDEEDEDEDEDEDEEDDDEDEDEDEVEDEDGAEDMDAS